MSVPREPILPILGQEHIKQEISNSTTISSAVGYKHPDRDVSDGHPDLSGLKSETPDPSNQVANAQSTGEFLILPSDPALRLKYLETEGKKYMTVLALACRVDVKDGIRTLRKGGLKPQQTRELILFLNALLRLERVTTAIAKKIHLKSMLEVVLNRTSNSYEFEFPQEVVEVAEMVYDYFEAQEWGAVADREVNDSDEEVLGEDIGDVVLHAPSKRKASSLHAELPSAARREGRIARPAPENHPIYGARGIMHDILRLTNPITYTIGIPTNLRHSYNHFGDNGFTVGDWWPLQICLVRDGVHGGRQSGIHGTIDAGAISIIVSGAYEGMDEDKGDVLYYSGSDSHKNTDPRIPNLSNNTKCMQKSRRLSKPIRVIRSERGRWSGTPVCGLRYDGLYRITNETISKNLVGGAYIRFKLERLPNQLPIDLKRPNEKERRDYELIKSGY